LRDGSFRLLVAVGSEGIITFPSVHAALAIIVIAALWPIPALRFVAIAINLLMLLATPIDGSHYFVDIAAGVALAVASLVAARAIAERACAHGVLMTAALAQSP
jgi:membrane-associated phospholipid phosphatase